MTATLTHQEILEYIAAGCAVTVQTGDSVVTIRPLSARGESPPMSAADRARAYRARKSAQSVTPAVTVPGSTVTRHTANVTNEQENPPSPSPPSPDPSLPAHTPARESASEAPAEPKPPDRRLPRPTRASRTTAALAAAQLVELDMLASPALKAAWSMWQQWRSARDANLLTGERPAPWTEMAARSAAAWLTQLAAKHGDAAAVAANREAIARRWLAVPEPKATKAYAGRPTIGPNHGSANQAAIDEYK